MRTENLQTLDYIKTRVMASFMHRELNNRPLLIVGEQGIGKTQMVQQAAATLTADLKRFIECRIVPFHAMEPSDVIGLPIVKDGKMTYAAPAWFALPNDGTAGILFIDEVNRIERDVLACFYGLILNREVGEHKLSPDWIIVAACNPSEGDQVTYDVLEMDPALMGRFRLYGVSPNVKGFLDWFEHKYTANSVVYQFLVSDNDIVSFSGKRGTPRDFECLEKSLMAEELPNLSQNEMRGIIAADIGPELAASFLAFYTLRAYCTPEMILFGDWDRCEHGLGKIKQDGRYDITTALMRAVPDIYLRTKADKNKPLKLDNIVRFMEKIGAEKSFAMLQLMINRWRNPYNPDYQKKTDELILFIGKTSKQLVSWLKELLPQK